MADFWVNGIVSHRDHLPYIQLSTEDGVLAQLSMMQARKIALDMLVMSARTEMDAMLWKFVTANLNASNEAGSAMMTAFRDYRAEIDDEEVISKSDDRPDEGGTPA